MSVVSIVYLIKLQVFIVLNFVFSSLPGYMFYYLRFLFPFALKDYFYFSKILNLIKVNSFICIASGLIKAAYESAFSID